MEKFKGGFKSYWECRTYSRIDGSSSHHRPRGNRIKLSSGTATRYWYRLTPPLIWVQFLADSGNEEVPAFSASIEAHQKRITEAIIRHALEICKEKNVEVKTQVVVGDPKETICEVATNLKGDLLVMGCRAYGPIKRNFYDGIFRKTWKHHTQKQC